MPNIKSQIKRVKTSKVRNLTNVSARSTLKTAIKRFESAVEAQDMDQAKTALQRAVSTIDKAAQRGLIHKNNASRKKSRLMRKMGKMIQAS